MPVVVPVVVPVVPSLDDNEARERRDLSGRLPAARRGDVGVKWYVLVAANDTIDREVAERSVEAASHCLIAGRDIRHPVSNALVTIDTGPAAILRRRLHGSGGLRSLPVKIHRLEGVTIAALAAVRLPHARPFVPRKVETTPLELLRRID